MNRALPLLAFLVVVPRLLVAIPAAALPPGYFVDSTQAFAPRSKFRQY